MEGTYKFEEQSMQSLIFSDSLKELRTLRSQLYSAADYFESAYRRDDQKQKVMQTLKDYTTKAFVNTVDHLGAITFKVSRLVDQKLDEVSATELGISCIEQSLRTCQLFVDRGGFTQQSLAISTPKYHRRYIVPVGMNMPDAGRHAIPNQHDLTKIKEQKSDALRAHDVGVPRAKPKEKQPSFRKMKSVSRTPSHRARSSSPAQMVHSKPPLSQEKRSVSPAAAPNPLARSSSTARKASLLKSSSVRVQYPAETQKLSALLLLSERNDDKDAADQSPRRSRKFLKSLLSRRKSRKDESSYHCMDEY